MDYYLKLSTINYGKNQCCIGIYGKPWVRVWIQQNTHWVCFEAHKQVVCKYLGFLGIHEPNLETHQSGLSQVSYFVETSTQRVRIELGRGRYNGIRALHVFNLKEHHNAFAGIYNLPHYNSRLLKVTSYENIFYKIYSKSEQFVNVQSK